IQPECLVPLRTQPERRSVPKRCVPAKRNPFPPARRYARGAAAARAAARIFSAAFSSRSSTSPQEGQTWVRIDRVFLTRKPQRDASLGGEPRRDGDDRHQSRACHRSGREEGKRPQLASLMLLASLWFLTRLAIFRSS